MKLLITRSRLPSRLQMDCTGVAAVEFAVVAPVFLVLLMGSLDAGHTLYTRSVQIGRAHV